MADNSDDDKDVAIIDAPAHANPLNETDKRILELCSKDKNGATGPDLKDGMPLSNQELAVTLNRLVREGKLEILPGPRFRTKNTEDRLRGLSKEERHVYQCIRQSGNNGIWTRDLKKRTNMHIQSINKALKVMEARKLIKAIKTVVASKKKVYMLFELTPDRSLTGGVFYDGERFDNAFAIEVCNYSYKILMDKVRACKNIEDPVEARFRMYATQDEVLRAVNASNVFNVQLTLNDIDGVLQALQFDGKVIGVDSPPPELVFSKYRAQLSDEGMLWRAVPSTPPSVPVMSTPCGRCPVFKQCTDGGPVSPDNCEYLNTWLDF